jgi:F-type H+-transporting ATPase subunit b
MRHRILATTFMAGALSLSGIASAASLQTAHAAHTALTLAEAEKTDLVAEEVKPGPFIVSILIFIALVVILGKFAWKPIQEGLQNREKAIRDSVEAAKRAKEEADRSTKELEAKIGEAQRQAAQQLAQAKADAQKIADAIRTQAEAESAALKDRTLREIDAAKQQAVSEINTHAAELGTAVARKILQRSVTVEDQQKLVEESLNEMAKKN